MPGLAELARRFSLAIESGRGIRLSRDELDLLVASGADDLLAAAAAELLWHKSTTRVMDRLPEDERPLLDRAAVRERLEQVRRSLKGG